MNLFMKRDFKQVYYVTVFLLFAVIIGIVLINNENFVGDALRGPLAKPTKTLPGVISANIPTPVPCPAGSIEITQRDVNRALQNTNNHGYMITRPGDYCLGETIRVDGSRLNIQNRGGLRVITVNSPGVTLNMNGNGIINVHGSKALSGSYGYGFDGVNFWNPGSTRTEDVAIRNGLVQGFDNGVSFASTGGFEGVTVEEVTFASNYNSLFIHEAEKVVVKNNRVIEANNGISVAGRRIGDSADVLIENNWLRGVRSKGISIYRVSGAAVKNNIIDKLPSQQNPDRAIQAVDTIDIIIDNNRFNNHQVGINAYFYTGGSYSGNTFCNVNNPVEVLPPAVLNDLGGNNFNVQNC